MKAFTKEDIRVGASFFMVADSGNRMDVLIKSESGSFKFLVASKVTYTDGRVEQNVDDLISVVEILEWIDEDYSKSEKY